MGFSPSEFEYVPNERLFPSMDANVGDHIYVAGSSPQGETGFTLTFLIDVIQLSRLSES